MKHRAAVLLAMALHCCNALADHPKSWDRIGYGYLRSGETVDSVLRTFANDMGVGYSARGLATRQVQGPVRAPAAAQFLDRLAAQHGFQWFVYRNVLHVAPVSDSVDARITVDGDSINDAKAALQGLGLFDAKFGWGALPEAGLVLVSGPRAYVDAVKAVLERSRAPDKESEEYMVFPLRHAPVTDRVVAYRDAQVTIPGVATLLRGIVGAESETAARDSKGGASVASATRMVQGAARAQLEGSKGNVVEGNDIRVPDPGGKGARARARRPSIEADVRSNSVLVRDVQGRRERYARLIAELDRPQPLVEIDALIIDIDRNKLRDIGVDWAARIGGVDTIVGGAPAASATGSNQRSVAGLAPGATLLVRSLDELYARIRLLESSGDATVIGRPSVLTLDNQTAVIDLTQTAYISLVGERVANLQEVTAGTLLRVTPRRIPGASPAAFELVVDIEDGSLSPSTGPGVNPSVRRGSVSTQAVLTSGQSLAVGGYRVQMDSKSEYRVPVLGELPVLGGLFRSTSTRNSARERLFVITPRFVDNPAAEMARAKHPSVATAERLSAPGPMQEFNLRESAQARNDRYAGRMVDPTYPF